RGAQALQCDEGREAPAFQSDVGPLLCDARRDAPTLSGCQQVNPTSTRKGAANPKSNP
ncbi:hypothetical protein HAX54_048949, partial [Datura stramonium]|nr:hypothetical protein [Datura stramonium]